MCAWHGVMTYHSFFLTTNLPCHPFVFALRSFQIVFAFNLLYYEPLPTSHDRQRSHTVSRCLPLGYLISQQQAPPIPVWINKLHFLADNLYFNEPHLIYVSPGQCIILLQKLSSIFPGSFRPGFTPAYKF